MNDYELHQKQWEGARAKEVLDNECWQWAFETIEQDIYTTWKTSRSEADRERMHQFHLMLQKVKATLEERLATGKLAELTLEHRKTVASNETWQSYGQS